MFNFSQIPLKPYQSIVEHTFKITINFFNHQKKGHSEKPRRFHPCTTYNKSHKDAPDFLLHWFCFVIIVISLLGGSHDFFPHIPRVTLLTLIQFQWYRIFSATNSTKYNIIKVFRNNEIGLADRDIVAFDLSKINKMVMSKWTHEHNTLSYVNRWIRTLFYNLFSKSQQHAIYIYWSCALLFRYVKLRVEHVVWMPGTFFPATAG